MLVLTRRLHETVVIGEGPDAITVTVTSLDGGKVRLAVAAPRHVRIDRQEVRDRDDARRAAGGEDGPCP